MHVRSANGTDKLQDPKSFRWERTTVTVPREGFQIDRMGIQTLSRLLLVTLGQLWS